MSGGAESGARARAGARTWLSRRSVLIAGASGLGVAGLAAVTATGTLPFSVTLQHAAGVGVASPAPATKLGTPTVERVYSAARGREVDLLTMLPAKAPSPDLPISLMLHGLHGNARHAAPTGLFTQLSSDVATRVVPAYGFVAVDGGDDYWHENTPGDNPMAMLLEEVPRWLQERGLAGPDGLPFACTGLSMGGFGALLYTRRRIERGQPPAAVAAIAPALITSWPEMSKRRAFHDATDWGTMDPLRHVDATKSVPTGVWCGTEDAFIGGVRRFIRDAHPAVAHTAKGRHDDAFNRTVVPGVISFLGKHVPRT